MNYLPLPTEYTEGLKISRILPYNVSSSVNKQDYGNRLGFHCATFYLCAFVKLNNLRVLVRKMEIIPNSYVAP